MHWTVAENFNINFIADFYQQKVSFVRNKRRSGIFEASFEGLRQRRGQGFTVGGRVIVSAGPGYNPRENV